MQAFFPHMSAAFLAAATLLAASNVGAQSPGGAYLPPTLPRPPAAALPQGYPRTTAGAPAPAVPSTAAGQIRLIEPENTLKPAEAAAATEAKGPPADRDAGALDARVPSRPAAATGQDPTVPGPEIQNLLGGANANTQAGPPPLPGLRLRARIFARNKPPMAVIDIGGQSLAVKVGSQIQFSPVSGGTPVQMRVVELTTEELQIEVVGRKQTITLN